MKFTMALRPFLSLGYVLLSVFAEAQLPILGLLSRKSAGVWRSSWKIWKNRCPPWLLPGSGHRTGWGPIWPHDPKPQNVGLKPSGGRGFNG